MLNLKAFMLCLGIFATASALGAPNITRAPFFSEPSQFSRIGIEIESQNRKFPTAAVIASDRLAEILMAKGYQVVDMSLITPEMRSGLAVMKVSLNQLDVRRERNQKSSGGGWLGEQNRKYGASHFYSMKGNVSVSVAAADTGSRLWMATHSAEINIDNEESWDRGLGIMLQEVATHYPGIDDKGVSVDDKVLSKKTCGAVLGSNDSCKVGGSDVRLIRQISDEPCIKDVSWRYANGVLSTEKRCRAEFAVIE